MSALPRPGSDGDLLKRVAGEIRRKKELQQSLDVAKKRQLFMLPDVPQIDGYEFDASYEPAAEISGDFYDFIDLGAGRIGVLIADVSGHGVEAAIVMGLAKKSLSFFARSSDGPTETLTRGNDDLCADLDAETFLTAVYVVLDAETGVMAFARAGHPMPVLWNPKRTPPHQQLKSRGMMVGMTAGARFARTLQEVTVELVPGDLVFLYTDGLTEARSPSGEQFGLDRLLGILGSKPRSSPTRVLEAVRDAVDRFTGGREHEDDMTMIAFRRTA
jgi:sigma-B regulation protein RsbU (phosphoserine phosphatase)